LSGFLFVCQLLGRSKPKLPSIVADGPADRDQTQTFAYQTINVR
jgi:hypothetical protein